MLTIDKNQTDAIIDGLLGNNDLTASPEVWYGLHQIKNLIATEIIYCHECIHYKPMSSNWGNCYVHGNPPELHRACLSCDYCSWAKRSADD